MDKNMEDDEEIRTMRKNFRSLCLAHGWTIEELSKISGVRIKVLRDIEEGRDFKVIYLIQLCNLYHIATAKIFTMDIPDPASHL